MRFWHGGNLDVYDDMIAHKKGRSEHGPGLYLITHYGTARQYAKGSRKLYMVTVEPGRDLRDSVIQMGKVKKFVMTYVIGSKRKMVLERLSKWEDNGAVDANILNNVMINEEALKPSVMGRLRELYVSEGIDYTIVDNPFGWHEKMMVLFNMKKIIEAKRIMPTDKIDQFDL